MTRFRFRPNLESMDERIVPNGAPVSEPSGPQQLVNAAPQELTALQISEQLLALNRQLQAEYGTNDVLVDLQKGALKDLNDLLKEEVKETANLVNATALLNAFAVQFGVNSPQYMAQSAVVTGIKNNITGIKNQAAGVQRELDRIDAKKVESDDRISMIKCQIAYLEDLLNRIPHAMILETPIEVTV